MNTLEEFLHHMLQDLQLRSMSKDTQDNYLRAVRKLSEHFNNTEIRITTDGASQWYPDIFGDIVVWHDNRNGPYDIYIYNLSTNMEIQITGAGVCFIMVSLFTMKTHQGICSALMRFRLQVRGWRKKHQTRC